MGLSPPALSSTLQAQSLVVYNLKFCGYKKKSTLLKKKKGLETWNGLPHSLDVARIAWPGSLACKALLPHTTRLSRWSGRLGCGKATVGKAFWAVSAQEFREGSEGRIVSLKEPLGSQTGWTFYDESCS